MLFFRSFVFFPFVFFSFLFFFLSSSSSYYYYKISGTVICCVFKSCMFIFCALNNHTLFGGRRNARRRLQYEHVVGQRSATDANIVTRWALNSSRRVICNHCRSHGKYMLDKVVFPSSPPRPSFPCPTTCSIALLSTQRRLSYCRSLPFSWLPITELDSLLIVYFDLIFLYILFYGHMW